MKREEKKEKVWKYNKNTWKDIKKNMKRYEKIWKDMKKYKRDEKRWNGMKI